MTSPSRAIGHRFAVATPHRAASLAALECFQRGGNSIDAALTASAVLTVVYPHMCSIGGDLFALISTPKREIFAINASGRAPIALDANRVAAQHQNMPQRGPLTITVPGVVSGWQLIAEMGAKLGFASALEPAVRFAHDGVEVSQSLGRALEVNREVITEDQGMSEIFARAGQRLRQGDLLVQPRLAATLSELSTGGPDSFYRGKIGERLASGLGHLGSPLSIRDLEAHRAFVTGAISCSYRDWELLTTPPNSQGFALLVIMRTLETLGVVPDPLSESAAVMAEVFRLASIYRDEILADADSMAVSTSELLTDRFISSVAQAAASSRSKSSSRLRRSRPSGDTVGVVATDDQGWAIALNQSVFGAFGSGILEKTTGIICHNRGAYFSLDRTSPNLLQPGKRPAHTLMPVMVRRDGNFIVASATMGSNAHPQIHAQLLMHVLDQQRPAADAVALPRWLVGGLTLDSGTRTVFAEKAISPSVIRAIESAGMNITQLEKHDEAVGHAQVVTNQFGLLAGGSDPRADGSAEAC